MNNTIPNVPRELLERAWRALANSATGREIGAYLDADPCAPECAETCARASMCAACSADLSAPAPAGVDGWDVAGDILEKLSDAQAIIDGLRARCFSLVMNCAAELETASYCMTDEEAKRIAQSGADYYRKEARLSAGKEGSDG